MEAEQGNGTKQQDYDARGRLIDDAQQAERDPIEIALIRPGEAL